MLSKVFFFFFSDRKFSNVMFPNTFVVSRGTYTFINRKHDKTTEGSRTNNQRKRLRVLLNHTVLGELKVTRRKFTDTNCLRKRYSLLHEVGQPVTTRGVKQQNFGNTIFVSFTTLETGDGREGSFLTFSTKFPSDVKHHSKSKPCHR